MYFKLYGHYWKRRCHMTRFQKGYCVTCTFLNRSGKYSHVMLEIWGNMVGVCVIRAGQMAPVHVIRSLSEGSRQCRSSPTEQDCIITPATDHLHWITMGIVLVLVKSPWSAETRETRACAAAQSCLSPAACLWSSLPGPSACSGSEGRDAHLEGRKERGGGGRRRRTKN